MNKILFVTLLGFALASQYGLPVPNDKVVVSGRSASACTKTAGKQLHTCHGIIYSGSGRRNVLEYFNGLRHATRSGNGVGSFNKPDGTVYSWDYSEYEAGNWNRYKDLPESQRVQACYDDVQKHPFCGNKYFEFDTNNYCHCFEYGITECSGAHSDSRTDVYTCPESEAALVQNIVTEADVGPDAEYITLGGTNFKNCLEATHNGKQCDFVLSWQECQREAVKMWSGIHVQSGGLSGPDPIGCYASDDNGTKYLYFNAKYFAGYSPADWHAGNTQRHRQLCRCGGNTLRPYENTAAGDVPQFVGWAETKKSWCPDCDTQSGIDQQINWACKYKFPGSRPALASEISPPGMYQRVGKGNQCADANNKVLATRTPGSPWGGQSNMVSCITYCYSDPQCVAVLVKNVGNCPYADFPGTDSNQQKDQADHTCMMHQNKECIFYGTGSRYSGGDSGAGTPTKAKDSANHVCFTVNKNWSAGIANFPDHIPYHHGVVPACRQFAEGEPALDTNWGSEADCSDYYGTRVAAVPDYFEPKFYYWFPTPLLQTRGMAISYMITPCVGQKPQDGDDCEGVECGHGSCTDLVNDYECVCDAGYDGDHCGNNIDECLNVDCGNGSCSDLVNAYKCVCNAGYDGRHCEIDINECENVDCGHGSCSDLVNDYKCVCDVGYDGHHCKNDIDDCIKHKCANNGFCIDGVAEYTCSCVDPFKGDFCEDYRPKSCPKFEGSWRLSETKSLSAIFVPAFTNDGSCRGMILGEQGSYSVSYLLLSATRIELSGLPTLIGNINANSNVIELGQKTEDIEAWVAATNVKKSLFPHEQKIGIVGFVLLLGISLKYYFASSKGSEVYSQLITDEV